MLVLFSVEGPQNSYNINVPMNYPSGGPESRCRKGPG